MINRILDWLSGLSQKVNLRIKLLITYTLIGILPLAILFFISFSIISRSLEDKAYYTANQAFRQVKENLEKKTEYISGISDIVSFSEIVQEVITRDPTEYENDIIAQNRDYLRLKAYFQNIKSSSQLYHISFYLAEGPVYTAEKDIFYSLSDASEEGWLDRVNTENPNLVWFSSASFKINPESNNPLITAVKKMKSSTDYTRYLGYLRLDILENEVKNQLNSLSLTPNTVVFLINSKNEIICSSESAGNGSDLLLSIAPNDVNDSLNESEPSVQSNKYDDKLVFSSGISGTDWQLLSITPKKDIIGESLKIRDYIILLLSGVILLTLFFSFLITRSITKRLFSLVKRMRQVDKDTFDMEIMPKDKDEIGYLVQNFNYMLTKIAFLMDEKYELGKDVKSAELKALQAQINPHFLYNTLDLINWIAIENKVPQISSLVKSMSKYYKLSLNKGRDIVTLKEELEHIREYLFIQNTRYENKIKLIINVPEECMNYSVLKLTLQPIVENSILHGILKKDVQEGTVEISCMLRDNELIMEVRDDGMGIPPEKLQGILTDSSTDSYHGYGIKNIHTRYQINYGEKYGLSYESAPGSGTVVSVKLPAIQSG